MRCASLEEAREIAHPDPLVRNEAIRVDMIEWQLVGVDPDAVDRDALLF